MVAIDADWGLTDLDSNNFTVSNLTTSELFSAAEENSNKQIFQSTEAKTVTEVGIEAQISAVTEAATESEAKTETRIEATTKAEAEAETKTETKTGAEAKTKIETETEYHSLNNGGGIQTNEIESNTGKVRQK